MEMLVEGTCRNHTLQNPHTTAIVRKCTATIFNYEKWWDEAEVRGITTEQLQAENIAYNP